jgi:UDP-glucose/GDP-mannose dehydrogenase family, NAD binding domain
MRIAVIGSDYVGLATGARLAEFRQEVRITDADTAKTAVLRDDRVAIYEAGLQRLVSENSGERRPASRRLKQQPGLRLCSSRPAPARGAATGMQTSAAFRGRRVGWAGTDRSCDEIVLWGPCRDARSRKPIHMQGSDDALLQRRRLVGRTQ